MGIDPLTGRHRIAAEVLEGMRQYLLVNNNEDWVIKADRIRKSVCEVEKDPIAKKSILRLETPLLVHPDAKKDKGVVFDYGESENLSQRLAFQDSSFRKSSPQLPANSDRSWLMDANAQILPEVPGNFLALSHPF